MTYTEVKEQRKLASQSAIARKLLREAGIIRKFRTCYQGSSSPFLRTHDRNAIVKWIIVKKKINF